MITHSTPQKNAKRSHLGRRGEAYAAAMYRKRGAKVLANNVRYAVGELDLIVQEPSGTIVFVEVKTRSGIAYGAAEAVTARKLARMRRAASQWLDGKPLSTVRFDVVALTVNGPGFDVDMFEGVTSGAR